jgi:nicotinate dehydrogenase subunit B
MTNMIDRRALMLSTGALLVTFGLTPGVGRAQTFSAQKTVSPNRVDGFLAVSQSGRVTVILVRSISAPACAPPSRK